MGNTRRHIDRAVDEAMETQEDAQELTRVVDEALSDGEITLDEAKRIQQQALEVLRDANEVVKATERANVAELVLGSLLKDGRVSPRLLRLARDVDLELVVPLVALPLADEFALETATA